MRAPAFAQVAPVLFLDAGLIENNAGSARALRQLELHQRVVSGWPGRLAPHLHNPAIRSELNGAPLDLASEKLKSSTSLRLDLRRRAGKRGELLRVKQDLVNTSCGRLEIDLLMNDRAGLRGLPLGRSGCRTAEHE